jgi:hypothetical protein
VRVAPESDAGHIATLRDEARGLDHQCAKAGNRTDDDLNARLLVFLRKIGGCTNA